MRRFYALLFILLLSVSVTMLASPAQADDRYWGDASRYSTRQYWLAPPAECRVQRVWTHRNACTVQYRRGELQRVSEATARRMTRGRSGQCLVRFKDARIPYSILYCINGNRYVYV